MKNTVKFILITLFALNCHNSLGQKVKKTEKIIIKTSAQCEMCKIRIEKALAYEKGVKSSSLDIDKATLTVIYKISKTTPEKIRKAINKAGYDADHLSAEKKAYDNLPECCKKGGMNH